MTSYLARLKTILAEDDPEKGPPQPLTKLTEAPFVSFVSTQGPPVLSAASDQGAVPALVRRAEPSPVSNPAAILACDYEERAAILEYDVGLPRSWAEMFARQLVNAPPGDFSPTRWQAAIDGALSFADQWAVEAHWQGWAAEEVFGLHRGSTSGQIRLPGLSVASGRWLARAGY